VVYLSGVFRILILRVPSVNRIFPLRVLTAGAISLFLNNTGAIAPMAPVLNTPLSKQIKIDLKNMLNDLNELFFGQYFKGR